MISSFRREVKKYTGVIYFAILALALPGGFALFFSSPHVHTRKSIASVNGVKVPFEEYYRSFAELQNQISMIKSYAQNYGFSEEMFMQSLLGNKTPQAIALDRSINGTLLDSLKNKYNISIDRDVFKELLVNSIPQNIVNEQGVINMDAYQDYVHRLSLTPAQFESTKEIEFERDIVNQALMMSHYIPKKEARALYLKHRGSKSFEVMTIPFEQFLEAARKKEISKSDLDYFYMRVQESYRIPEKRLVTTWSIPIEDYTKLVTVDDTLIKQFYEKNKSTLFRIKPKVKLRTIVLNANAVDDKLVQEVLDQLQRNPDSFVELVKKHSIDTKTKKNDGVIDYFTRGTHTDDAFENAAFRLKNSGEISPAVKTVKGVEILQLIDRIAAQEKPFEEVRDEIRKTLQGKRALNDLRGNIEHLIHDLKKGKKDSLNKFLEDLGISDRSKKETVSMSDQKAPGFKGSLAQSIFKARKDMPYGYAGNEHLFVVYHVEEIQKSFIPKQEEIIEEVREAYYKEQAHEAINKVAKETSETLFQNEKSLEDFAKNNNYEYATTSKVTRRGTIPQLKGIRGAATKVFGITHQKQLMQLTAQNNDKVFVRLLESEKDESIKIANEEKGAQDKELIKQKQPYVNAIIASLRKLATIKIDEDVLSQFAHSR